MEILGNGSLRGRLRQTLALEREKIPTGNKQTREPIMGAISHEDGPRRRRRRRRRSITNIEEKRGSLPFLP